MFDLLASITQVPPGVGWLLCVCLSPVLVLTLLVAAATVVALAARTERGDRAEKVLLDLLNALLALCRCGGSKR